MDLYGGKSCWRARLAVSMKIYWKYDIRSNWRSEGKGFLATTILFL